MQKPQSSTSHELFLDNQKWLSKSQTLIKRYHLSWINISIPPFSLETFSQVDLWAICCPEVIHPLTAKYVSYKIMSERNLNPSAGRTLHGNWEFGSVSDDCKMSWALFVKSSLHSISKYTVFLYRPSILRFLFQTLQTKSQFQTGPAFPGRSSYFTLETISSQFFLFYY